MSDSARPAPVVGPAPGVALDAHADALLQARSVTKRFGGLVAVRDVDLTIPVGSIVSIIGPNGAGKTTFFNVIAGIIDPTEGSVEFRGRTLIARPRRTWLEALLWVAPAAVLLALLALVGVSDPTAETIMVLLAVVALVIMLLLGIIRPAWYTRALSRLGVLRSARPNDVVEAGIGRTFQNIRLFQNMTALENVLVGMHLQLRSSLLDHLVSTRRQAREEEEAARRGSDLLRLVGLRDQENELAKNLPYGDQRRLELARALGSQPSLLLLDEPTAGMNPNETAEMTQLIGRLRSELGLTVLLIEHDMRVVMGISDHILVLDHGERIAQGTPAEVRRRSPGHRRVPGDDQLMETNGRTVGEVLLRLSGVHTYYGKIHALQGVDIDVREGEIVTLIGSNGAGKTTTLKTISGLLHPREGTLEFRGRDVSRTAPHRLVREGIGHSPEGRRIFSRLSVTENLQMGGFTRSRPEVAAAIEEVFELFPRLRERSGQKGGTLSGGEQQMLAIGRALMTRPRVLLLDEPSLGLAPILIQQIFAIIRDINSRGTTILLVEQNAQQALEIADRGYVLQTGRVILTDSAANLAADADVRRAYLGEI